jgi:glycerol-3-phosphate O-acyltransferase/dihydroxyacetone phosphate acyltransferase
LLLASKPSDDELSALNELIVKSPTGLAFKIYPHLDQSIVYEQVFDRLHRGECIGIFPEGGSHDRTEMLPLKAGVTIMALGAMASKAGLDVKIVPVGLNYFHPHRFRSRAAIEFGEPISIDSEHVDMYKMGGEKKRKACGQLLQIVYKGLRAVTVNVPSYEDLLVIQAAKRLYRPPGTQLSIVQNLELTRKFAEGYLATKDKADVKEFWAKVMIYNQMLKTYGLKDHQVMETAVDKFMALRLLALRLIQLTVLFALAFPMVVLNMPVYVIASRISAVKAEEALKKSTVKVAGKDVLATWKLLVALVVVPLLYTTYSVGAAFLSYNFSFPFDRPLKSFLVTLFSLPVLTYVSLIVGEQGLDIFKSIPPLFHSLFYQEQSQRIRMLRANLEKDVVNLVEELGPSVFPDFDRQRIINLAERQHMFVEPDSSDEMDNGWLQWKEISDFSFKSEDVLYNES